MTESKRNVLATALLVFLALLLFADVVFFGRAFFFRDLTRFYYPTKKLLHDIIAAGEFPFWNPTTAGGQPLAANPDYGTFYPGQWLLLLPGFDFWFRLHIVLHFALAAVGAFVLLRRCTSRIESALFGAIVFGFGGLTLGLSCLLPYLYCIAWLPWILWAVDRRRFALTAIFTAMVMLGGEPVTIAQVCVLTLAFAWLRAANQVCGSAFAGRPAEAGPHTLRAVAHTALAMIAAAFVGAVQIVPAADLLRDTARVQGFPFEMVSRWSTPPIRIAELFIPQFTGLAAEHFRLYWGTAKYGWLDPFYPAIYFGIIPAALAFAAMTRRVFAALVVSFILAIGIHTPLLRWLFDAHLFRSFRYPEKFLILGLVPLMLFSAIAFDRALTDWRIAKRASIIAGAVSVIAIALLAISFRSTYARDFVDFWGVGISPFAAQMAELSRGVWLRGAITAIVATAVLWFAPQKSWASVAIAITILDLAIQRPSIAETVDGDFFRTPPAAAQMLNRSTRLFHQAEWYGATVVARQYFDLPQMYWVVRNGLFPMVGSAWHISTAMNGDIDRTFLRPAAEFNEAMLELRARRVPLWFEPLMAMSAAGYRALYLPFEQQVARAGQIPTAIQPAIFLPVKTNPMFYFADRIMRCRTREDFVSAVAVNRFDVAAAYADMQPFAPAPARVVDAQLRYGSATLHVEAAGNALLVCSITRHKYWSASIDDRPATLLPVNIQYQALLIPPGRHTVRLRYRNPVVVACAVISLISLCVLCASAVFPVRRK